MWFTSLTAVGEAIKSLFDFAKTTKEQQINTEVLYDKRDIDKANDYALKDTKIADKYLDDMTLKDRLLFKRYYNNFLDDK